MFIFKKIFTIYSFLKYVITNFLYKYLQHVNYSQYTFDKIDRKKYYSTENMIVFEI